MKHFEALAGETSPQKFREPLIFFDREDTRTRFQNKLGEGAEPWPEFNNVIFRNELRFLYDPAGEIPVVEEILPERFHRRNADFPQRGANLGKFHREERNRPPSRAACGSLFTKKCEQSARCGRFYSQVIQLGSASHGAASISFTFACLTCAFFRLV